MTMIGSMLAAAALAAMNMPVTVPAAAEAPAPAPAPGPALDNCYRTFWPSGRDVEIEACEYASGTSGYTILRNNSRHDMSVCWTLEYGNGKSFRGCNFRIRAGEEARSSCYACNRQHNGGLKGVEWRKVERAN